MDTQISLEEEEGREDTSQVAFRGNEARTRPRLKEPDRKKIAGAIVDHDAIDRSLREKQKREPAVKEDPEGIPSAEPNSDLLEDQREQL